MKLSAHDRELRRLREASERISSNLVELELDAGRQLLDAITLEGASAARSSAAGDALTELWRGQALLEDLLGQAERERDPEQLRALLEGPSIELASSDVPLSERTLLGSAHVAERCTPGELIDRMSRAFDEVKSVVSSFGLAWETLTPKLETAGRLLQDARNLAEELSDTRAVEAAAGTLAALRSRVASDPLSVPVKALDELIHDLGRVEAELHAAVALKRGFETRILEARELLGRLQTAVREARAAHEELVTKISAPTAPTVPQADGELPVSLTEITALAQRGDWHEARSALDEWTAHASARLDEATRALEASRAPIAARNQFRALLDAYQVKAARLGLAEDRRLAAIFERAHRTLYTAPTDLALAAQLVRSYQQALGSSPPTSEVMP